MILVDRYIAMPLLVHAHFNLTSAMQDIVGRAWARSTYSGRQAACIHARRAVHIVCLKGLKSSTKAYIESYALEKVPSSAVVWHCSLVHWAADVVMTSLYLTSIYSITCLEIWNYNREKRPSVVRTWLGCKQIPSPLGSQSSFTVAARGSHAGSKSPFPLESKKLICVVDRCS